MKINALKKENADISIKFKRFQEQMANKLRMVFISTVVLGLIVLIAMIVLVFKINNKIHREISRLSYQYNITPSDERYDGIEYSEQIYTETEAQSVNSITFHIDNLNIQNDFQLKSVTHIIFNPPGSASIADITWKISPAGVVTINKKGYIKVNQDKRTSEDQIITATAFIKNQNMGSFTFTVIKQEAAVEKKSNMIKDDSNGGVIIKELDTTGVNKAK